MTNRNNNEKAMRELLLIVEVKQILNRLSLDEVAKLDRLSNSKIKHKGIHVSKALIINDINALTKFKSMIKDMSLVDLKKMPDDFALLNQSKAKYTEADVRMDEPSQIDFREVGFEDFVVKSHKRRCIYNHKSEYIKARFSLLTKQGDIIEKDIPAGYCATCKCFFIIQSDYEVLKEWGVPLCQQLSEKEFMSIVNGSRVQLNIHSKLNILGYSVGKKDDLSEEQRHGILALALDKGVYTKAQLDDFLRWLINSRAYNEHMKDAISKWEKDRLFIQGYNSQLEPIVKVRSIK